MPFQHFCLLVGFHARLFGVYEEYHWIFLPSTIIQVNRFSAADHDFSLRMKPPWSFYINF